MHVQLQYSRASERLPRESMMFINYQIGHHLATVVVRLMPILYLNYVESIFVNAIRSYFSFALNELGSCCRFIIIIVFFSFFIFYAVYVLFVFI